MVCKENLVANWEFFREQWEDNEVATGMDKQTSKIRFVSLHLVPYKLKEWSTRWPTVGRQLAVCRPSVGRLSADCRPTVGQLSTDALADVSTEASVRSDSLPLPLNLNISIENRNSRDLKIPWTRPRTTATGSEFAGS